MARMIKLHHYLTAKDIWINADAIISVVGDVPKEGTSVYTYAYAGVSDSIRYRVAETPETVVGLIEQACNPLSFYPRVKPEDIQIVDLNKNQ